MYPPQWVVGGRVEINSNTIFANMHLDAAMLIFSTQHMHNSVAQTSGRHPNDAVALADGPCCDCADCTWRYFDGALWQDMGIRMPSSITHM
jgi:hypothetical protein